MDADRDVNEASTSRVTDHSCANDEYKARLLCIVDDICTRDILDRHLGFVTHKTKVAAFSSFSKRELKYLHEHKIMYNEACAPSSRFTIKRCLMYKGDGDVGAKVVATKEMKSGTVITELCGRLVTVGESFLKPGQNDFSVVHSTYMKKSQLWLGPASYANHDCESNCDTYFLKKGVACLRANRAIRVGDEITTFYGHDYFVNNHLHCLCLTCKRKGEGAYSNTKPPVEAKPFLLCAHCPARFNYKSWLVRHMSKHMDMAKYLCLVCGESFSRKFALKRHTQVHDTMKNNIKCKLCSKTFTRKEDALIHDETIHKKMSIHKCRDCESTFNSKKDVMYHHNRKHSGLKPFACEHCEAAFPAPNALYHHKKRQH